MMADAHHGAFDVLVVWALDRLGRSMVGNLRDVLELDRCGVQVVSVRETWLDTGSASQFFLASASTRVGDTTNSDTTITSIRIREHRTSQARSSDSDRFARPTSPPLTCAYR